MLKLEANHSIIIQSMKFSYFTLSNKKVLCIQCWCSVFVLVHGKQVVLEQMRLRTIWQPSRYPGGRSTTELRDKPGNRCICVEVETMMEEKAEADLLFDRKSKIDSSIEACRQWTEKGQRQMGKQSCHG